MLALIVAIALLAPVKPALPGAQAKHKQVLYVHNSVSGEITKIAVPAHEIIGEIKIGVYMDYVTASPSGDVLYVNRIDPMKAPGANLSIGETGELIAINTATDQVMWRVKFDAMPHHMTVSADGRRVFVPYYNSWWVAVVDVEKRAVVKKIFVGNGPHVTKLSPDGKRLYVGSMMNDHIAVIDTEKLEVTRWIPFTDAVRPFAFTRDEKRLYVQLSRLHGFVVVDLATGKTIRRVDLPRLSEDVKLPELYPHTYNHGILLSRDERYLFANGSVADYVAVYSHPDLELIKTIPVGRDPNYIAMSKDGEYIYVSNRGSNDISIISVRELKEVKRLKVGRYPQRMVVVRIPEE